MMSSILIRVKAGLAKKSEYKMAVQCTGNSPAVDSSRRAGRYGKAMGLRSRQQSQHGNEGASEMTEVVFGAMMDTNPKPGPPRKPMGSPRPARERPQTTAKIITGLLGSKLVDEQHQAILHWLFP
jgi:hypothetical protein